MATPATVAASMLKIMVLCLTVFWIVSFSIGRMFVFYETYTETIRLRYDESYLLKKCADSEFYSNMRRHTDVCVEVQRNSERNPVFVALNAVANTAHLCGRYSCSDAIIYLSNGGWPVLLTVGFMCLFAPMMLAKAARVLVNHGDEYKSKLPYSKMA
jgi:hypothetical protein